MRPRIFRSRTEMRAKSVRNTASTAAMLVRAETICITQSGAPARGESKCCFARTKIWSITSVTADEESGRTFFNQERTPRAESAVEPPLHSIDEVQDE